MIECNCTGPWTQTVHSSNPEGHQVGCARWGATVGPVRRPSQVFGGEAPLSPDVVESDRAAEYVEHVIGILFHQAVEYAREVNQELDWATFRVAASAEPDFGGVVLRLEVAGR